MRKSLDTARPMLSENQRRVRQSLRVIPIWEGSRAG